MKKTLISFALALAFVLCAFGTVAYAKNFNISFTLTPGGSSGYSGDGYKVDDDPKCYITTTGGSVVTNLLTYKFRGKELTSSGRYVDATVLSDSLQDEVTGLQLRYISPYLEDIIDGEYAQYDFSLAASLHSGTPGSYNLVGRWNP